MDLFDLSLDSRSRSKSFTMAVRSELSLPARIKKARAMERSAKRETAASDDVSTAEKKIEE